MASGAWRSRGVLTGSSTLSVSMFSAAVSPALLHIRSEGVAWTMSTPRGVRHGGET